MGIAVSKEKAGAGRILVVDDDPGVREAIITLLRTQGWEAEGAMDGLEALTRLQHGPFDVVVTDFQMPRLDGVALLQEIRKLDHPLPVVIQTALLDPTLEILLRHAGAFHVLRKGGPVSDIVKSIQEACLAPGKRPA